MPLQDVTVTINIKYPAPRVGLGRPVIFTQKAGEQSYKEYSTLDALKKDYAENTNVYKKANTIFLQPNRPDVVAVATYDTDLGAAMAAYYSKPWHFALLDNDDSADQVKGAGFIGTKDFKFFVAQVKDKAGRDALKGKPRVIIFDHDVDGEYLDAAAVGNLASLPVGSITWKFKSLKGVTARTLDETEMSEIDNANANAYVKKAGKDQLSEGKLADGEYIDGLHGQDWTKADMENEIQYALQNADKVPYDARGINLIEAAATTTLQRSFANGIIAVTEDGLPDYTITALGRNQVDPQDRNERVYNGLSFDFANAGAIHAVRVKGVINI